MKSSLLVLILISLMIKYADHLFMHVLALCVSSGVSHVSARMNFLRDGVPDV